MAHRRTWMIGSLLSVSLLCASFFGYTDAAAKAEPTAAHRTMQHERAVQEILWRQTHEPDAAQAAKWASLSVSAIAKLGTRNDTPPFAGRQVVRFRAAYAPDLLRAPLTVALSHRRQTLYPDQLRKMDGWRGELAGHVFAITVYESRTPDHLFVVASAYDGRTKTILVFPEPLSWVNFTGRFVVFAVPEVVNGEYQVLDLTTGHLIANAQVGRKMADTWNEMGGQSGNVYGLTGSAGGGPTTGIPGVNYEPYYYPKS